MKQKELKSNLFDYGCSWGYGSFQLKKIFNVVSYEISTPRAEYAKRKLNINVLNSSDLKNIDKIKNNFEFFFMSHVLEHLPKPNKILKFGLNLLKKDGFLVCFTPNGSIEHKKNNKNWSKLWGMVHPNMIDENFYKSIFADYKYYIGSVPYDMENIQNFVRGNEIMIDNLSGKELMIIVKKH